MRESRNLLQQISKFPQLKNSQHETSTQTSCSIAKKRIPKKSLLYCRLEPSRDPVLFELRSSNRPTRSFAEWKLCQFREFCGTRKSTCGRKTARIAWKFFSGFFPPCANHVTKKFGFNLRRRLHHFETYETKRLIWKLWGERRRVIRRLIIVLRLKNSNLMQPVAMLRLMALEGLLENERSAMWKHSNMITVCRIRDYSQCFQLNFNVSKNFKMFSKVSNAFKGFSMFSEVVS